MSKYGSFNIKGMENLRKAITEKYSGQKTARIINSAVYEGTKLFADELSGNVGTFKDKGHEQEEIVATRVRKTSEGHIAKVGWNGPKKRYALVHLNEFGYNRYGKQYTPRGFGVIDKTIRSTGEAYQDRVARKMREML